MCSAASCSRWAASTRHSAAVPARGNQRRSSSAPCSGALTLNLNLRIPPRAACLCRLPKPSSEAAVPSVVLSALLLVAVWGSH